MIINNHFTAMNIARQLNDELMNQNFAAERTGMEQSDRLRLLAQGYANVENALAVLSDMYAGDSHIYYGGFSRTLGMSTTDDGQRIGSIWEKEILERIHPDDLHDKYLLELRFFHYIKHLPRSRRSHCYLVERLRMKNTQGEYIPVLHRMFYIAASTEAGIRFALCLYTPLPHGFPAGGRVVDSITGQITELEKRNDTRILSRREKQVLHLIDHGMASKHIADTLSISINTVSRHRQQILRKLKVKNSIEACRIAKDLDIITK